MSTTPPPDATQPAEAAPWASETFEHQAATIRRIAEESFAAHEITVTGPGEFRCGKPGSGDMSFRLILRPGVIILYGDLGAAIFEPGTKDPLAWLQRGAIGSRDYVLEKLRTARQDHFYPGDVLEYVRVLVEEEYGPKWEAAFVEAKRLHGYGELNPHTWYEIASEAGGDSEMGSYGQGYTAHSLWHYEALRWFCAHVDAAGGGA